MEHKLRLQVFFPRHIDTEVFMSSKLLASALLTASLLAAPAIALAQSETTAPPETKSEATAPKAMHHHAMHRHMHMAHRPHFSTGTTTGMSAATNPTRPGDRSVARRPSGN